MKRSDLTTYTRILACVIMLWATLMSSKSYSQILNHQNTPDMTEFREIYRDTVEFIAPTEIIRKDSILEPMRVVTNKFNKNWFLFATGGAHTFLGDYSNLGPFKGTITPDFSLGVGKWFTPGIAVKVEYIFPTNSRGYTAYKKEHYGYGPIMENPKSPSGVYRRFKTTWWDLSASVIFNLSRLFRGYEGMYNNKLMNQFLLSGGIGIVHHTGFKNSYSSANEISGHLEFQYSRYFTKAKILSLDFKFRGLFYQTNFDGEAGLEDYPARKVDCNLGLYLGLTWNLGSKRNNGWGNSVTEYYQRDFRQTDILVLKEKDVVIEADKKAKQGVLTFYVFYPNNYSGRNDAPLVERSEVNTLDYLAGGLFTQKRYADTSAVTSKLLSGNSLNGLRTVDIPTELAEEITFAEELPRGYEMSSTEPLSLSLNPEAMTQFREKEGFYYAPIYDGQHVWEYRIDDATLGQHLLSNANYSESQTYGLNSHKGLPIIKDNMKLDDNDDLVSFADVYAAINGNTGHITDYTDEATVEKIKEIFDNGIITMVQTEGMATSQDNSGSTKKGEERNSALSENRANSVIKWLQQNENLNNALYQSFFTQGANTINTVNDASTRGLNAKLNRGVKVRVHYLLK